MSAKQLKAAADTGAATLLFANKYRAARLRISIAAKVSPCGHADARPASRDQEYVNHVQFHAAKRKQSDVLRLSASRKTGVRKFRSLRQTKRPVRCAACASC